MSAPLTLDYDWRISRGGLYGNPDAVACLRATTYGADGEPRRAFATITADGTIAMSGIPEADQPSVEAWLNGARDTWALLTGPVVSRMVAGFPHDGSTDRAVVTA